MLHVAAFIEVDEKKQTNAAPRKRGARTPNFICIAYRLNPRLTHKPI